MSVGPKYVRVFDCIEPLNSVIISPNPVFFMGIIANTSLVVGAVEYMLVFFLLF